MNAAHAISAMQNPVLNQVEGTKMNSTAQLGFGETDFNMIMASLLLSSEGQGEGEGEATLPLLDQLLQFIKEGLMDQQEVDGALSGGLDTELVLNEEELIPYLEELLQLFDELEGQAKTGASSVSSLSYEQLYSIFQQLPISTSNLEKITGQGIGHDASAQRQQQESLPPVLKWNLFLQAISKQQADENVQSDMSIKNDIKQATPLVASLLSKWQQNPEWLKFLKEKVQFESVGNSSTASILKTEGDSSPRFPTYMPTALLVQSKGQEQKEGMEKRLTELTTSLANKAEASPGIEQRAITLDVKGNERTPEMKVAEPPVPTARFSHLLEDMKGILKTHLQHLQQLKQGEGSQIRVKLSPEHLGHLDIRITSMDGKVSAQLMASNQLAKEALEFQVGQLRTALTQQGIQVDRIEVTQQNQSQSMLQDQRGGQHLFQQKGQGQGNGQGSSSDSKGFTEEEAMSMEQEYQRDELGASNINYVV
jgi:flagellar hook-length control protein FliK